MTATTLSSKKVALGRHTQSGGLIVDCTEKPSRIGIRFAALDGDCALPGRRKNLFNDRNMQAGRDELMTEPVESSLCQKQALKRRLCGKLAQTGRHIAANFHEPEVVAQQQDLHLSTRARGSENRSDGQSSEATRLLGNENVRGVCALKDRTKDKVVGLVRREIFQTVDRCVDLPGDQGLLKLLCEEPPGERTGKTQIKTLVSGRLDGLDVDLQPGMSRTELVRDDPRLREREIAAARSKNDAIHRFQGFSQIRNPASNLSGRET